MCFVPAEHICTAHIICSHIWLSTAARMDRQLLLGQVRSSASLPELLAHEENCRSRLTVQVESMYKMQKTFHRDQQSHVSHLRKQREGQHCQHVRRRPLSRHFGGLGGSYNQHTQLGNCFQQVQQLDEALAMIQTKKDQLQDQHKKAMLVKPIQASGLYDLKFLKFTKRRLGYLSYLSFMYFSTCGMVCLQSPDSLVSVLHLRGVGPAPSPDRFPIALLICNEFLGCECFQLPNNLNARPMFFC